VRALEAAQLSRLLRCYLCLACLAPAHHGLAQLLKLLLQLHQHPGPGQLVAVSVGGRLPELPYCFQALLAVCPAVPASFRLLVSRLLHLARQLLALPRLELLQLLLQAATPQKLAAAAGLLAGAPACIWQAPQQSLDLPAHHLPCPFCAS
jgi:hypothetical protein